MIVPPEKRMAALAEKMLVATMMDVRKPAISVIVLAECEYETEAIERHLQLNQKTWQVKLIIYSSLSRIDNDHDPDNPCSIHFLTYVSLPSPHSQQNGKSSKRNVVILSHDVC